MREFMVLVDHYASKTDAEPAAAATRIVEATVETAREPVGSAGLNAEPLLESLHDLAFKLRGHSENDDGAQALGFEAGMQRAAEMIDNLLRRHGAA